MNFDFVESMLAADLMEDGAFCHWTNPATGEPAYLPGALKADGTMDESKAVGAYVRSTSSKVYAAFEERVLRRSVGSNRKARSEAQRQEIILAQMKNEAPERFAVLIARFQNTSLKAPGVWTPTEDEKKAIAADPHNKAIVEQNFAFAADPANYGMAEETAGNADADA